MSKDLPILAWISHNPMGAGGFQGVTRNLMKRLDGWDKHVVSLSKVDPLLPYTYDGYNIYETSSVCGLRHHLGEISPDVVVVYGAYWHMEQYLEAVKHSNFTQVLYLVIEAPPVPIQHYDQMSKFDMIMTPCMASAQTVVDCGFDAYLLHHGVDQTIFYPGPKTSDVFTYGSVKVNNFKAQLNRLVSAYAMLSKDNQDTMLLLHTNPLDTRGAPLKDMVNTYGIEDKVRFSQQGICQVGMTDVDMANLYRSLDVYVSSSGADTVNLPALEAAACGIPLIMVDVPGPQEYIGDAATYIPHIEKYPSGFGDVHLADVELLADAMSEYYDSPGLRRRKADLALQYAKKWSWEKAVAELKKNLEVVM